MRTTALVLTLIALAGAFPAAARAQATGQKMFVVRGRVLDAKGAPVADAFIRTRGSVLVLSRSDDAGRFVLVAPLGTAAALRREPFTLEMRVESDGRRFALAGAGGAFTLEVRGDAERVRIRSNSAAAADAVLEVLLDPGATSATVELAFGGAERGGRDVFARRSLRVLPDGSTERDAVAAADRPSGGAPPAPAAARPAREKPARADTTKAARRGFTPPPVAARTSAPKGPKRTGSPVSAERLPAGTRVDTAATIRPAPSAAGPTAQDHPSGGAPTVTPVRPESRKPTGDRRVVPSDPRPSDYVWTPEDTGARVRRVEPFAAPPRSAARETCECILRGTVELAWGVRPLEERVPVTVSLAGLARAGTKLELFMGPPREFQFGPLPCGDYRVEARARGRVRYELASGDSVTLARCGAGGVRQVRIVLQPARR